LLEQDQGVKVMARARNIKPGFFRNADLVELPFEARLLFIGLWTMADRDGRMADRPKQIKMELFPADSVDCDALLNQLAEINMIARYEHDGKCYLQVVSFAKHQNPHRDEKASTLPDQHGNVAEPKATSSKHGASTVQARCKEDSSTVAIGLIPDPRSLIPDSLIPDCLTGEGESAVAPAKPHAVEKPDEVDQQVWSDWLTLRKAKKAPATQTVLNSAINEADKAGLPLNDFLAVWCLRGSQGLEASWLKPDERNQGKPFLNKHSAAAAAIWGNNSSQKTGDVIDV
jgi:hypothetical protein